MASGETESKKCNKCGGDNDRGGRTQKCSKCMSPRSSTLKKHVRVCPECGLGYSGRTRIYCSSYCRNTANNKAKIARAGSKVVIKKKCNNCGEVKPAWEFNYDGSKIDGLSTNGCRKCQAKKHAEWRARNPNVIRNAYLQRSFGITSEKYDEILESQNGVCALCGRPPAGKRLAVDHDHQTGELRALLCHSCNRHKVGNLTLDDVTKIKKYLENPPIRQMHGGIKQYVPAGMEKPKTRRKKRAVSRRRIN
jgi:hypothetical protein